MVDVQRLASAGQNLLLLLSFSLFLASSLLVSLSGATLVISAIQIANFSIVGLMKDYFLHHYFMECN